MKKILVLLVVVVVAFSLTIPAAATGNGPGGQGGQGGTGSPGQGTNGTCAGTCTGGESIQARKNGSGTFALTGTLTAIGTDSVTIQVLRGNKLVQPQLNTLVTVKVTDRTRYLLKDGTTTVVIGFADLQAGQVVSVNGTLSNGTWTATRLTVGASLSCLP